MQCPNCGGYRVTEDKVEGLNGPWGKNVVPLAVVLAVCGALSTIPSQMQSGIRNLGDIVCCTVPLMVFFFFLCVWLATSSNRFYAKKKMYWYKCLLCGYQWTWKTGDALPIVHDRPDLRQVGEQRLQAEEAAMAHHVAEDTLRRQGIIK